MVAFSLHRRTTGHRKSTFTTGHNQHQHWQIPLLKPTYVKIYNIWIIMIFSGRTHISYYTMDEYYKMFFFYVILIFVLQWAPPICHSIIFPAPAWAAPTVFQHRTHSSCTGRDTLWGAVPPHWRNGHMGLAGLAPSGTAQMKVSIAVTLLDMNLLIYLHLYIDNFSFYAHVC